jgi:hypothetical protein
MITCEICGKAFEPSMSIKKYCSKPCANAAWLAGKRKREKQYRSEGKIKSCLNCGKNIARDRNVSARRKYCSRKCAFEHRKAHPKPKPIIYKNCIHCGNQFIQERQARYCGDECRKATARKKSLERDIKNFKEETFICKQCGKESKRKHGMKNRVFCSTKCLKAYGWGIPGNFNARARHKLRKIYGEKYTDHYQPINRITVLERDGYVCYICGDPMMKEAKGGDVNLWPSVDHVVPLAKGGDHLYPNCRAAHLICNSFKRDVT